MKITAPKGTRDILPPASERWIALENALRGVARTYGFGEVRFPTFEATELFTAGIGDTTDVVGKEMYTFLDKGNRSMTLRPEGTASVARLVLEHGLHAAALPFKGYYIAPNFRYENPQKGRLREHHQFGVECLGAPDPAADAEVLCLAADVFRVVGLTNVTLSLSSIGCAECRPVYREKLIAFLDAKRADLCPDCQNRLDKNPLRVLDCKICAPEPGGRGTACESGLHPPQSRHTFPTAAHAKGDCVVWDAPLPPFHLCPACEHHKTQVETFLTAAGIAFTLDPWIVRGLDYYVRTVFEFKTADGLAVLGGGRYDGLLERVGGPAGFPGIGFGCGLERLLMAIDAQSKAEPPPSVPDLALVSRGDAARAAAVTLARDLREQGFWVETDLMNRSVKAQMKYTDKIGAAFTMVIGDDEMTSKIAKLRNMSDGTTAEVVLTAAGIAPKITIEE